MTDGVLNIYKEKGKTSFYVVAKLRKILGIEKIGHTGTLDPDATGVLPICLGRSTKLVDYLMDTDKTYKATMIFGISTDTQDISGTVIDKIETSDVFEKIGITSPEKQDYPDFINAEKKIKEAFKGFTGDISQLPPMYSAIKVNGVKLVNAARKGHDIERKPRTVRIYEIKDVHLYEDGIHLSFEVRCSKGTYIRTLCFDLGAALGVPACLESLERTSASGLKISDSILLEEVEKLTEEGKIEDIIIPTDYFLQNYKCLTIIDDVKRKIIFGNQLRPEEAQALPDELMDGETYRMYDSDGKFYALYIYRKKDNFLKVEKMFV